MTVSLLIVDMPMLLVIRWSSSFSFHIPRILENNFAASKRVDETLTVDVDTVVN